MIKLDEAQKIREYDLTLKKVNTGLAQQISIINEMLLNNSYCILTYHLENNLLRIKIYESSSEFSDLKVSCTLQNCKNINNILTTANSVIAMQGVLQFSLNNEAILHIDMYEPSDRISANRLNQILNAIKK